MSFRNISHLGLLIETRSELHSKMSLCRATRPRLLTALGTPVVLAIMVALGLAGCAADLRGSSAHPPTDDNIGVFTGEYVEGVPVYRFPSILVIGSRSGLGDI